MFERPVASATQPALSWLGNWGTPADHAAKPFDISLLKPAPRAVQVAGRDLLEITVWNLFEPEQPHTFPARVESGGQITVPLLGELPVEGHTNSDVENILAAEYQRREILVNPRVLVRHLETPQIEVYVAGAVQRPGPVQLPRQEGSVFASLAAAGGVTNNAGSHISIAHRITMEKDHQFPATAGLFSVHSETPWDNAGAGPRASANSSETLDVEVDTGFDAPSLGSLPPHTPAISPMADSAMAGMTELSEPVQVPHRAGYDVEWFDVNREQDRVALAELRLIDGDIVTVNTVTPPIRVLGAVRQPGSYTIPASYEVSIQDALQLAGGVIASEQPLNVTLLRPAIAGRGSQRWSMDFQALNENSEQAPAIQSGDIIQVEQPTKNKIKKTVGGWLHK